MLPSSTFVIGSSGSVKTQIHGFTGDEVTEKTLPGAERQNQVALRKFFHDVATPLSAVSLHMERAVRLSARGDDPTEALSTARRELERAFELFERGRDALLATSEETR